MINFDLTLNLYKLYYKVFIFLNIFCGTLLATLPSLAQNGFKTVI